ncbi:MAG: hypothetical protein ABIT38_22085, partial [Gemmatimonadaceae bacterium]
MSSRPPTDGSTTRPRPLEVAIVGNDALVAALPARPVQLSHAILAMGFDVVIPVSWGEELLAEHALRALSVRGRKPAIFCACTRLRERLLSSGSELASNLIAFVPPAVAAARHIRALHPTVRMRVTFIGGCDTGGDPAINSTISAADFLHRLAERGISAVRQPAVFDSIIPPDRRRHYSLPGGCPAPDALASRAPEWQQVTVDDESFAASLAELLISGERLLIDLAPRLACSCCSALGTTPDERTHTMARGRLADIEPPRAPAPILDHDVEISVDATPVRRIRAGTGPDSLARAYLGADAATRPPALGMPTSALPIPHPIREMGALTSAPREPDMRARVAHEHLLRDGGTRDHLTAALPVAPSPLQLEQPRREHQVDERVAQEADERISVSEELAPREASPSEREVMRTALPGDAGAAERTRGVFRIDAPRDHTSRRRIAVTPASVPITLPRVAMVATPTLAMVGESRKTAPSAGSAVRAPELTPIAGVEEVPVESEKTIPLERLTSDVDERAGAVVNATTAAAFTPEAQIEDTRIHDEGQANATQNLPTTSQLPRTHAAGRRHRTRVHETFLVARLAAHARATRAASARERGMASERPAIADTAPSSVDDAAIEHAFGAATEVVPAEPSREGAPNVDLVDSRRLDAPEAAEPLMEYGASDPATLIDVEVVVRIIDESAGVTRLASRTPRATGRVDD